MSLSTPRGERCCMVSSAARRLLRAAPSQLLSAHSVLGLTRCLSAIQIHLQREFERKIMTGVHNVTT